MIRALLILLAAAPFAFTQSEALLNTKDALALFSRAIQLTDSTSGTIPGLARAAAPVFENMKREETDVRFANRATLPLSYGLLSDLRAYLALADGLQKPFPYPDAARRQFAELRELSERLESHLRAQLTLTETQLRPADRDNVRRYAEANRLLPPPQAAKPRVVFYGDSITDSWRLNEYFPDRDFVNRGISGQVTGEMLGRMKPDVINLKPAAMLILAGTNDISRNTPLEVIENNLSMICDLADGHKIKVILASVLPVSDYHKDQNPRFEMTRTRPLAAIKELNTWIAGYAKQHGYTYLNYFDALMDASGQLKSEFAEDGLHPNADGYRIMAPLALEAIEKTLKIAPVQQIPPKKRQNN
jgi:lysophospholipase L1-like esterase